VSSYGGGWEDSRVLRNKAHFPVNKRGEASQEAGCGRKGGGIKKVVISFGDGRTKQGPAGKTWGGRGESL